MAACIDSPSLTGHHDGVPHSPSRSVPWIKTWLGHGLVKRTFNKGFKFRTRHRVGVAAVDDQGAKSGSVPIIVRNSS